MNSELIWLRPWTDSDPEPILRDAFADWETGAFFPLMEEWAPWNVEDAPSIVLSTMYFANRSGGKFCSPLVKVLINEEGLVDSTKYQLIANILKAKYLIPWTRLWQTNVVAYDPVTNYDMSEDVSRTTSDIGREVTDRDLVSSVNSTRTPNMTETTVYGKGTTAVDSAQGFNSSEFNPADKTETTDSGADTKINTGNEATATSQTDSDDATKTHDNLEVEGVHTHRVGNIGVTTNQKLVQEERNLWLWNYFNSVFRDIDNELSLAFYDPCRV